MKHLGIPALWAQLPPCTCSMLSFWVIWKLLLSIPRLLCIHKFIPFENLQRLFTPPWCKQRKPMVLSNIVPLLKTALSLQLTQLIGEQCWQSSISFCFLKLIICFPLPVSLLVPPIQLVFYLSLPLSLSARLKTRRRPWRRPRPTPPSLWLAWPTRSMP